MQEGSKALIVYKLYNEMHGSKVNEVTMYVRVNPDRTLSYVAYMGWQAGGGLGYSLENYRFMKALPETTWGFDTVADLDMEIHMCFLSCPSGSRFVERSEILNEL